MTMVHLHLIYVHGFRGDHTSFQAFPSDLYAVVRRRLPARIHVSSYLYPTYPSVRPIAHATQQFLAWLDTQPPGPVILLGHSMGGLLTAEAATSPAPVASRIVGVVGLDVPFLGLHPHVVVSGIASLLRTNDPAPPTERDMNAPAHVHIVPAHEAFLDSPNDDPSDPPALASVLGWGKDLIDRHQSHPVVQFFLRHSDDPLGAVQRWIVKNLEFGSSMYDPQGLLRRYDALVRWDGKWINYWTTTVPLPGVDPEDAPELLLQSPVSSPAALSPGLRKSDSSLSHSVLALPFGWLSKRHDKNEPDWWRSALPDQHELHDRLSSLLSPRKPDSSDGLDSTSVLSSSTSISTKRSTPPSPEEPLPHHFIVLPYNNGGRRANWYRITVAGARDEVEAHQGIFMRDKNLDYDAFVDRVARLVELWSRQL